MTRRSLFPLLFLLLTNLLLAQPGQHYYQRQAEGWFWYVDPPLPTEESEQQLNTGAIPGPADPRQALKALQEQVEIAQARAVMNPYDPIAMREYLLLNQKVSRQAEAFSNTWQTVLWRHPELDASLKNPTNQNALHTWYDERNRLINAFLEHTAQEWGLWYFYRSDCPYCERFSPVLASFANTTGFSVLPISQDGGGFPSFPDYVMDEGQSVMLEVYGVPAVYLVNPATGEIHPLAHGLVSGTDLAQRIYMILEGESANPNTTRFSYRSNHP